MTDTEIPGTPGRIAMVPLALAMLLASMGTSIANIALPALAVEFGLPFASVRLVVVAYLVALTVLIVIAGRLGDRFGHKRMFIAGLMLFSAASALCGTATDLTVLVAARVLQGAGAAFMTSLTMALVRDATAPEKTGRAMGWLGTMSAVGTALGPAVGGTVIAMAGWRWVFLLLAPIAVVTALLALWALRRPLSPPRRSPLGLRALADADLRMALAANLMISAVMMATLVVGPFYLTLVLGLDPAQVGLVMAAGPLMSMASGVPAGRLVDRVGAMAAVRFGLGTVAAGAAAIAVLPAMFGLGGYLAAMAVLTPGYQLFQAANSTAVMARARMQDRGIIAGLLGMSRNLGLIAGAWGLGAVFAALLGVVDPSAADPVAVERGLRWTFALAAMIAMAALIPLLRAPMGR